MQWIFFFCALPFALYGQQQLSLQLQQKENSFAVSAGMGVNIIRAEGIVEYINLRALSSERVDDWGTAVEFFGGVEFPLTKEWGLKFEHAYLFKTYNVLLTSGGGMTMSYAVQAPSLLVQRVYSGKGYFAKISLGGGYHFANAEQTYSLFSTQESSTAQGLGVKVEVNGQTAFDEHLFGYISGTLGAEFLGKLQNNSGTAISFAGTTASLNALYAGVRFGLLYYF